MLRMKPQKNKKNVRAMMEAGQYPLWPDENKDNLFLPQHLTGPSRELRLQRWPLSPRAEKRRALRLWLSQSLSSWLSLKNLGAVGFGMAKERHFEIWLINELVISDFGALEVDLVIHRAMQDLELDQDTVKRILAKQTSARGAFVSDGQIVTLR